MIIQFRHTLASCTLENVSLNQRETHCRIFLHLSRQSSVLNFHLCSSYHYYLLYSSELSRLGLLIGDLILNSPQDGPVEVYKIVPMTNLVNYSASKKLHSPIFPIIGVGSVCFDLRLRHPRWHPRMHCRR